MDKENHFSNPCFCTAGLTHPGPWCLCFTSQKNQSKCALNGAYPSSPDLLPFPDLMTLSVLSCRTLESHPSVLLPHQGHLFYLLQTFLMDPFL